MVEDESTQLAPDDLKAVLDDDGKHVDFIPGQDFYGTVMFRVMAIDYGADEEEDTFDDLVCRSNYFNVTVKPVNDAPVILEPSGNLAVNESEFLKFNVKAVDVDDTGFTWETNNTEKVSVMPLMTDSSVGQVVVTPSTEDVGKKIHFELRVTDSGGTQGDSFKASGSLNVSVDVININNPPKFVELTLISELYSEAAVEGRTVTFENEYAAVEDEYFNVSVIVEDPDLGIEPEEKMTYEMTVKDEVDGLLEIDSETGEITFLPTNADVGFVEFTVKVKDWQDEEKSQSVEIEVKNSNDPPRDVKIVLPEERQFTEEDKINFQGECQDDDLDVPGSKEVLTFMWFTNHSKQPLGMDEALYYRTLEPGWHEITLRVVDVLGESVQTSIELEIQPVVVDDGSDDETEDDTKDDETTPLLKDTDDKGAGNTVYLAIILILIIIISLVLVFFLYIKPKKKKEEEEAEEEAKELTQPFVPVYPAMQPGMQYPGYPQQYGYPAQYGLYPQPSPETQLPAPEQYPQVEAASVPQPQVPTPTPQPQVPKAASAQKLPLTSPPASTYDPGAVSVEAKPKADEDQQ
jgi:hypothetical protein